MARASNAVEAASVSRQPSSRHHGSERRHAGQVESHEEGEDNDLRGGHGAQHVRGSERLHQHEERKFFAQHAENQRQARPSAAVPAARLEARARR